MVAVALQEVSLDYFCKCLVSSCLDQFDEALTIVYGCKLGIDDKSKVQVNFESHTAHCFFRLVEFPEFLCSFRPNAGTRKKSFSHRFLLTLLLVLTALLEAHQQYLSKDLLIRSLDVVDEVPDDPVNLLFELQILVLTTISVEKIEVSLIYFILVYLIDFLIRVELLIEVDRSLIFVRGLITFMSFFKLN